MRGSPRGVQGQNPCRDPGYFVPQKLKQNVTLLYIYFNVLCMKNIQDFIGKGVELMAINWVQSSRWKQTQPYTEFDVNVWHV